MKTVAGGDTLNRHLSGIYNGRGEAFVLRQKKICDSCQQPLRKKEGEWACVNPHCSQGRK